MSLVKHLRPIVGDKHVLAEAEQRSPFERDWTGRFTGSCLAVVLPGDVNEAARVVAACIEAGVRIVPQGGNTGLAGGAVPSEDSVVLSSARLTALDAPDTRTRQITAGAGVTLEQLQTVVTGANLFFPVDHAARGSATIGGAIATNAGGSLAWRYGPTRAHVAGIEAVLGNGEIVRDLRGLVKNNTGYDLSGLLVGSEGTLGFVSAARLRLVPLATKRATVLLGATSMDAAVDLFLTLRQHCSSLWAAEFFFDDGLSLVCDHADLSPPLDPRPRVYLLAECASSNDPRSELEAGLGKLEDVPAVLAQSESQRASLWAYRERQNEAITARGVPRKMDVAVPLDTLARFCTDVTDATKRIEPQASTILFGHVGDGNVHVNVLGANSEGEIEDAVFRLATDLGGTISAEHGIGRARNRWLTLSRSHAEIEAMRAVKRALDPAGLLNPGVLFED